MPFKTFTASVLSSADMNTYLMKQSVITCTSGTRPSSPVQGMTIYETDNNLVAIYDGSSWVYMGGYQAYTPALGNITLGNGTLSARWAKVGDLIVGNVRFAAGSTTTYSAGNLSIGLPVNAASTYTGADMIGYGQVNNGSGATRRLVNVTPTASSTTVNFVYEGGTVANTTPFTFGTSSQISFSFACEQA